MAQGRKTDIHIFLSAEERHILESWQKSTTISQGLAKRGKIIPCWQWNVHFDNFQDFVLARGPVYKWASDSTESVFKDQ